MPDIYHRLLIGTSAETVYDAITSEQGLSAWWTPDTKIMTDGSGIIRFGFGPDYHKDMEITESNPATSVKWVCKAGAEEWIGTNISFQLLPGKKDTLQHTHAELSDQLHQQQSDYVTLLIFHHDDWKDYTPMFGECSYTWARFLRSLQLFCETGKGLPWPNQHRT